MVNSIDQDGTGNGFDMELVRQCMGIPVPLIVAGGAGKPEHFADILALPGVDAAATGNLFNFIGKGFERVRAHLLEQGLPVRSATL
jgi:imidazole glycerol phosphate synthase subunit HisF